MRRVEGVDVYDYERRLVEEGMGWVGRRTEDYWDVDCEEDEVDYVFLAG